VATGGGLIFSGGQIWQELFDELESCVSVREKRKERQSIRRIKDPYFSSV